MPWSLDLGFDQGVLLEGVGHVLHCSGQTAVDAAGDPCFAGDMSGQVDLVLDNLAAVLAEAKMAFADVVRLMIFTTDVPLLLECHGQIELRLGETRPASTLLGVNALAMPELMVEIQAMAMR